ncbi:MAG: hypothetical protein EPN21_08725 [Methylococcaceae bacterium]|nr:MAG: hypothetical protein EPN21_08725 [Methylococcaceae bacterium]
MTVILSRAASQTVTVDYVSNDGTALAGNDYTATSGTLAFSPGDLSKTFEVAVLGDIAVEPGETFTLTLSNPCNATLSSATARVTINNDDLGVVFDGLDLSMTADANSFTGTPLNDRLLALDGNDSIHGADGRDSLVGGTDHDTLVGGDGNDTLDGGVGNDILYAGRGNDSLLGGEGDDRLGYSISTTTPLITAAQDEYGNDTLNGGAGNDTLNGGTDADTLLGGSGVDGLTGGTGNDQFVFNVGDSGVGSGNRDIIANFNAVSTTEVIDLTSLSTGKLTFNATAAFSAADQVRYSLDFTNQITVIQINLDADLAADLEIQLTELVGLSAGDFVL